jgi:streptomycin 6-kinase
MNLPPDFIATITNTFGADGEQFIANLPLLIDEASARWGLTNIQPVSNLSYNFVAFADSPSPVGREAGGEGLNVVLKLGVPRDELTSEMTALKLFNGEGACRLIDCDEEKGFLLLERLHPGMMLSTLEDDEEATRIAAEVMQRIWRPLEHVTRSPVGAKSLHDNGRDPSLSLRVTDNKFIQLTDWFDGLKILRQRYYGGTGPLDEKLVGRVEQSVKDFFIENHNPVLMHGDFHHYNILSSAHGWLVIDPKGVLGPAGYEVGPFMLNPWGNFSDGISRPVILRRVDILHEQLGFERQRIIEWSLAHAVLSAWWGLDENTGWDYAMQCAELFASL